MLIRIKSDLHLNCYAAALHQTRLYDPNEEPFDPFWYPPELPTDKDTVLILAGDLWEGTKWVEYAGYSWIEKVAPRFKQVLVVLGNHCLWSNGGLSIQNGADKCNAMLQDHCLFNVHVLDCASMQIDDVLFVGATLWTDMNKRDPLAMMNMTRYMRNDGNIAFSTGPNGQWERFTSERWVHTHDKHRKYIQHVCEQNRDKKIVVITHHVPLLGIGEPAYRGDVANAYYESDLSELILDNPQIKGWVYGHTHYQREELFGETLMVNNNVGYAFEHHEEQGLVQHKVWEI